MTYNGSPVHTVITFDDGCLLIFAGKDQIFGMVQGHPDWNLVHSNLHSLCVIRASGDSNHSKGIYYLGTQQRLESRGA